MLEEMFPKVIEIRKLMDRKIPFISADHSQIHQALLNLCVNARDAMPNGGTLTIRVGTVALNVVQERFVTASSEHYVCISVSDTGVGMDEKTKNRVFDPFFTTKEKGKGTGLGLSVVYGVMQTHHGFVDVESEVGKGTTFSLFLPVPYRTGSGTETLQFSASEAAGGTETILIVEDELVLREVLQTLLESKGYHIYSASDGQEAIEVFRKHRTEIAIVLTDIGLPKISGFEEFRKLREINPHVKVLLASGFLEPDMKSELFKAGAKGFIQKPYSPDEILRLIREVLDEKNEGIN